MNQVNLKYKTWIFEKILDFSLNIEYNYKLHIYLIYNWNEKLNILNQNNQLKSS
jgi:hypothetical protein